LRPAQAKVSETLSQKHAENAGTGLKFQLLRKQWKEDLSPKPAQAKVAPYLKNKLKKAKGLGTWPKW
jgi:hypothetical protein